MCQGLELEWLSSCLKQNREYVSDPILEVGSRNINGNSMKICKELFPTFEWIGLDKVAGNEVTRVGDAHNLPFPDGSIGTVISTNTLEHLKNPMRAVEEMKRVLKPNGLLILIVPSFGAAYHHEGGISLSDLPSNIKPCDYWQISLECMQDIILEGLEVLNVEYLKNEGGITLNVVLGCAKKPLLSTKQI